GNFYMLGSMGLASALALGLALLAPRRRVVVVGGDGSALMSLGTLPLIGAERPTNLIHVVLDNGAYESTGAQPSIATRVDLAAIGRSSGYRVGARCDDRAELAEKLSGTRGDDGPCLLIVKTALASARDVPRVSRPVTEIRDTFRESVRSTRGRGVA